MMNDPGNLKWLSVTENDFILIFNGANWNLEVTEEVEEEYVGEVEEWETDEEDQQKKDANEITGTKERKKRTWDGKGKESNPCGPRRNRNKWRFWEEEVKEIRQQPVKADHSNPNKAVQVSEQGPLAAASGVQLLSVLLRRRPRDVTTLPECLHKRMRRARSPSNEVQGSNWNLSRKRKNRVSGKKKMIPLFQLIERLRNENKKLEVEPEKVRGPGFRLETFRTGRRIEWVGRRWDTSFPTPRKVKEWEKTRGWANIIP